MDEIIYLLATIAASCLVMMIHESVKTLAYACLERKRVVVNPLRYIDPVGLIFSVAGYCGFSKPYRYRGAKGKTRLWIGYAGLSTLLLLFIACVLSCRNFLGPVAASLGDGGALGFAMRFLFWTVQYMAVVSLGMFLTNLIPIVPFDVCDVIAGFSRKAYLSVSRQDYLLKMAYFLIVILGVIKAVSVRLFLFFYA